MRGGDRRGGFSAVDYLRAGLCTAVLPVLVSFGAYWTFPWACDVDAWLCILPFLLIWLAPFAALVLSVLVLLSQRLPTPFPHSWIMTAGVAAVLAQIAVSVSAFFMFEPYVRSMSPIETLMFPHGLVAGAILGSVFWIALVPLGGIRPE